MLVVTLYLVTYFNSIKVRLRPPVATVDFVVAQFQFHKGSIKTLILLSCGCRLTDFNSIKVRLRHLTDGSASFVAQFQFHKGSIKTLCDLYKKGFVRTFQFHKGSIKTTREEELTLLSTNFNSIKVRLRQGQPPDHSGKYRFQFHKGSIKTFDPLTVISLSTISIP